MDTKTEYMRAIFQMAKFRFENILRMVFKKACMKVFIIQAN